MTETMTGITVIMILVALVGMCLETSNRETRRRIAELDKKIEKIVKKGEEK